MDLNFICERILNNKKFEVKIYMRQSKFKLASARNSLALAANLATREVVGIVVVVDNCCQADLFNDAAHKQKSYRRD